VTQPFDFSQIFQALLKLVLRFEFQRVNFLSAVRAVCTNNLAGHAKSRAEV
jgi:hypothetical protein